jgi:glutamate N-acetyltransferase/amino-acid N-acetyltransferase
MTIAFIDGGVTAPAGLRAAGVAAGIKKNGGLDVSLVESTALASAAAVFTTNKAVAAPVLVSREHLAATHGRARAVVINSGCANACTGPQGMQTARLMAAETARAVGCEAEEVLVASTGVIGVQLDQRKVSAGIIEAAHQLSPGNNAQAAVAIMTTDPFPKEHAVRCTLDSGASFAVGGMAKGSGMIEPNLATMLAVVTTDAAIDSATLRLALVEACEDTFNAITVDGECSTNDTVFALASGASGVSIDQGTYAAFVEALREVCMELALGIVRGGEGATKLVTVHVTGAATYADAKQCARAIANSLLVKTAIHGGDPNWGRLVAVAGRSGSAFDLMRARVLVGETVMFEGGRPFDERAPLAAAHLAGTEVDVTVDLGMGGDHDATMFTCDLTADYVRINADYRT